jgi:ubiquinone/menaquinone biosynthesis C-methylase UbiE
MQMPATWDLVANGYAEEVATQLGPFLEETARLASLTKESRVLDVATGPGSLAIVVAPRVASVVAVDFSPGMIAALGARATREGITNIDARVMDAQALSLPDASFDVAFCLFGFMFFPDRARAFAEMKRVLRPGGRAVVATWAPIEKRPFIKVGFDAIAEAMPELPRPAKGDLQSIEECEREMSAAGFRDVRARAFTAAMHVASAEAYVTSIEKSGAPIALLKKMRGEEAWLAVRPRVVEAVARRVPSWPADLPGEALLTMGTC